MANNCQPFFGWVKRISFAWLIFGALVAPAEDRIKFSLEPSSKVTSQPTLDRKSSRPFELLDPNNSLGGVIDPVVTPAPTPLLPRSREQKELLDRQKNWIFADPNQNTTTAESALRVREYGPDGKEKEFKSLMEKYLTRTEERPQSRTNNASATRDPLEKRDRYGAAADRYAPLDKQEQLVRSSSLGSNSEPSSGTQSTLLVPVPTSGDIFGGSSLVPENKSLSFLPTPNQLTTEKTAEQKAWAQEFRQLLDRTPPSMTGAGGGDPINFGGDATRQSINPVVGQSLPSLTPSSERRNPLDSLQRLAGPESLSRPGFLEDPNMRVLGTSSLSPAINAPPPPSYVVPKPVVLDIPKRR